MYLLWTAFVMTFCAIALALTHANGLGLLIAVMFTIGALQAGKMKNLIYAWTWVMGYATTAYIIWIIPLWYSAFPFIYPAWNWGKEAWNIFLYLLPIQLVLAYMIVRIMLYCLELEKA